MVAEDEESPRWRLTWLPINASESAIALDCSGPFDDPVPVFSFFPEGASYEEPAAASSMGDLVEMWIRAIDSGAWYCRTKQRWPSGGDKYEDGDEFTELV
jgi:hypothetical protein